MKTTTEKLVEIIEIIKGKIVPDTSIIWTRYNSVAELEIALEKLILGIRANDREKSERVSQRNCNANTQHNDFGSPRKFSRTH